MLKFVSHYQSFLLAVMFINKNRLIKEILNKIHSIIEKYIFKIII